MLGYLQALIDMHTRLAIKLKNPVDANFHTMVVDELESLKEYCLESTKVEV